MAIKRDWLNFPIDSNIYTTLKKIRKKRKSISKMLRDQVWTKYMGNHTQGKCYCCKIIPIHFQNFEVGHNKSVFSGGSNHINNLRPVCRTCNRKMGTKSIEWFRKKFFAKPSKRKVKKPIKEKIQNKKIIGLPPINNILEYISKG